MYERSLYGSPRLRLRFLPIVFLVIAVMLLVWMILAPILPALHAAELVQVSQQAAGFPWLASLAALSPVIAVLLGMAITAFWAWWNGILPRLEDWLVAHKQASLASAIASANAVIQPALTTAGNTILGQISRGELTDRASIVAAASAAVKNVEQNVAPAMVAIAAPAPGTMLAHVLAHVDTASPAGSGGTPTAATELQAYEPPDLIAKIAEAGTFLASVDGAMKALPVTVQPPAPAAEDDPPSPSAAAPAATDPAPAPSPPPPAAAV